MNTCLVTGANRGIGLELTKQLLLRGDRVVACCRNPETANHLNDLLDNKKEDQFLVIYKLDMLDSSGIALLPNALEKRGLSVNTLILNAGIAASSERMGHFDETTMLRVLHTNAIAPMLMAQAFMTHAQETRSLSKVVCISSDLGSLSRSCDLTFGLSYGMSKAALNMGMRKLIREAERRGIACISLHPGWVQTDMGGPNASLTASAASTSVLRVIDGITLDDSGSFLSQSGATIPW